MGKLQYHFMDNNILIDNNLGLNKRAIYNLGDCPNIELPTMGGEVLCDTLKQKGGLRLQQNVLTRLCRILDSGNIRKAWGSPAAMEDKFERMTRKEFLEKGDIIGITRGIYDHYAVYIGNGRVIHYAAEGWDFGSAISIHKASIDEFLRNQFHYFVLHFFENSQSPIKIQSMASFSIEDSVVLNEITLNGLINYHLYSPEETVERTRSREGEQDYNLVTNNCEHFAIWCKTGIRESHQVKCYETFYLMP